jgi:superfamily II DNA or RNA helicase
MKYENLYDYQKDIVDKLKVSKLLLMSVSSGKTYCSMFAYKKYGKGRLLILAPANMIEEWKATCKELNIDNYDIYSYNKVCMNKYLEEIINTNYDVAIIDEAHHISNRKNKSTKKILLKIDTIRLKYLLTATPENYEWQDFYIYFRIIFGKSFMSYSAFASRYFIQRPSYWNPYVYEVIGYVNEHELIDMKDDISIIYNKIRNAQIEENEVFIKIPDDIQQRFKSIIKNKVYKDYIIDSPAKNSYMKRMMASLMLLENDEDTYKFELLDTLKLEKLKEIIDANINSNIIIYYNYINERTIIEKYLNFIGYEYSLFTTKDDFKTTKPGKINMISYGVGSEGINGFKDCTVYIAFSLPYSKRIFKQSKGRINRLDNYEVEKYYYFINDIDKKVLEVLKKGQSFTDKLMEKNYA